MHLVWATLSVSLTILNCFLVKRSSEQPLLILNSHRICVLQPKKSSFAAHFRRSLRMLPLIRSLTAAYRQWHLNISFTQTGRTVVRVTGEKKLWINLLKFWVNLFRQCAELVRTKIFMAAATTSNANQMERLTTCPVCLDKFRIPKVLPCMHTFCLTPCLTNLVDPRARSLRCPECRREHQIPPGLMPVKHSIWIQLWLFCFYFTRWCTSVSCESDDDWISGFTTGE